MSADTHSTAEREQLAEAVRLATGSVADGGGPFGALITYGAEVVASGTNLVTTDLDPTAHAEVTAIRRGCRKLGSFSLAGCTLLTSCEPCPMCMASALWARVDRIVYAADRDDAARAGFDDREFYDLFTDPHAVWPTPVERLDLTDRTAPFDAWQNKTDRVEY